MNHVFQANKIDAHIYVHFYAQACLYNKSYMYVLTDIISIYIWMDTFSIRLLGSQNTIFPMCSHICLSTLVSGDYMHGEPLSSLCFEAEFPN